MCRIFAGTDPSAYQHVTRSVRIMGRATSIMLEAKFWEIVDDIASRQEMSTPQFLSTLYEEVLEERALAHGDPPGVEDTAIPWAEVLCRLRRR